MMKWIKQHFFLLRGCLMAMMMAVALIMGTAHSAQADLKGITLPDGSKITCPDTGVYTGRVVSCVKVALFRTMDIFLTKFSDAMQPVVLAIITLSIVFFGVKVLMGDNKLGIKAFVLLIKIGAVLMFTNNFGGMAHDLFDMMEDVQNIVTTSLIEDTTNCPATGTPDMMLWNRLDCLTGKILGFGANTALYQGIIGGVGMALFSGSTGFFLMVMGIAAIYMILNMVFRSVYIFLLAYSMVAFLIIVSPIMVPLILFNVTTQYFERWIDQIVSAMLQPMMLFAFLAFMLQVFETAIFDGPMSLLGVWGIDPTEFYRLAQPHFAMKIPVDPGFYDKLIGLGGQAVSGVAQFISPLLDHAFDIGSPFKTPTLDFGAEHTKKMQDMVTVMLTFVIVCYMMVTMMMYIPELSRQMVGSRSAVSLIDSKRMPLEGSVSRGARNFSNRVTGRGR